MKKKELKNANSELAGELLAAYDLIESLEYQLEQVTMVKDNLNKDLEIITAVVSGRMVVSEE